MKEKEGVGVEYKGGKRQVSMNEKEGCGKIWNFCVREKNIKVHVYLQKESLSVGERYLGAINSF